MMGQKHPELKVTDENSREFQANDKAIKDDIKVIIDLITIYMLFLFVFFFKGPTHLTKQKKCYLVKTQLAAVYDCRNSNIIVILL